MRTSISLAAELQWHCVLTFRVLQAILALFAN